MYTLAELKKDMQTRIDELNVQMQTNLRDMKYATICKEIKVLEYWLQEIERIKN